MPLPESAIDRLRCFRNALANWKTTDYVRFRERVEAWLRTEVPQRSLFEIRRLLHEFVANGGAIDEQVERRPEYVSYEFHYDLRLIIDNRLVYFEMILHCDDPNDPDDPFLVVVSAHDV